jgi:hypothetical protein
VRNWLFRLQDGALSKESRRYYTINLPRGLTGGGAQRQIDLVVKRKGGNPSDTEHDWKNIEVIGELKASNKKVQDGSPRPIFSNWRTREELKASPN